MILLMSREDQEAIRRAEESGNFYDPDYLAANARSRRIILRVSNANTPNIREGDGLQVGNLSLYHKGRCQQYSQKGRKNLFHSKYVV